MKKGLLITLLALCSISVQAAPMTWSDQVSFSDDPIYFSNGKKGGVQAFTFTHDLVDDGFSPGQDLIWDYDLSISLFDDGDRDRANGKRQEWAFIDLPGFLADEIIEVDYFDADLGVSLAGLFSLNATGLLEVTIERLSGDFYLGGSSLVANGKELVASIPEPATYLLLLLALSFLLLRKRILK